MSNLTSHDIDALQLLNTLRNNEKRNLARFIDANKDKSGTSDAVVLMRWTAECIQLLSVTHLNQQHISALTAALYRQNMKYFPRSEHKADFLPAIATAGPLRVRALE